MIKLTLWLTKRPGNHEVWKQISAVVREKKKKSPTLRSDLSLSTSPSTSLSLSLSGGVPRGKMAKVLDSSLEVNEFEVDYYA